MSMRAVIKHAQGHAFHPVVLTIETLKEQVTTKKRPADRPVGQKDQVVSESVEQQIAQTEPRNLQDSNLFNNYMGELGKW